ncbi:hypothetical protein VUR80DRAFT_1903 [Thermomyces stellatus]
MRPTILRMATRYTLTFYVPPASLAACKSAIFAAGAGRYPGSGDYTEACFVSRGTGQFRPGAGANPAIGSKGELESVEEVKVETICVGEAVAREAVKALKEAHPYEEPAYAVFKMEDF